MDEPIEILFKKWMNHNSMFDLEQRFGQWFCNFYIKKPWPELYYQGNNFLSKDIVRKWLQDHHYFDTIPSPVRDFPNLSKRERIHGIHKSS